MTTRDWFLYSTQILSVLIVTNLFFQGCSSSMFLKEDKYGCPEPSLELLEKMGVRKDFIELRIKDLIEGKIETSKDSIKLSDDLTKVLLEETLYSYTDCLLSKRDGWSKEQIAYLKITRYFCETDPSFAELLLFQNIFPFPSGSSRGQELSIAQLLWLVQLGQFMKTNPSPGGFIEYVQKYPPPFPSPESTPPGPTGFRVILTLPRDMIGADISVDGEPALVEGMQDNLLVIRVPNKSTNSDIVVQKGDRSCSAKQLITEDDIILALCESR